MTPVHFLARLAALASRHSPAPLDAHDRTDVEGRTRTSIQVSILDDEDDDGGDDDALDRADETRVEAASGALAPAPRPALRADEGRPNDPPPRPPPTRPTAGAPSQENLTNALRTGDLRMSLRETIQEIKTQSCDTWAPGQNLSRLRVSLSLLDRLGREICATMTGAPLAPLAGAALILFGVKTFHDLTNLTYGYEALGERLRLPRLADMLGMNERDAMERGARIVFGIHIVRSSGRRRFITTMLLHSGGSWGVLDDLCQEVVRRWSWQGIDAARDEDVAAFIFAFASRIQGHAKQLIATEEARLAVAQMLKSVAQACLLADERGWVGTSWETTVAAMLEGGATPASLLPMLDEAAASRILQRALELAAEAGRDRAFEWRWETRTHLGLLPRLLLSAPKILGSGDLKGLPPGVERVRLYVSGDESQQTTAPRLAYTRSGEDYGLTSTATALAIPRADRAGVSVLAEYRTPSGTRELVVTSIPFPWDPVAIFDLASGRRVASPVAGQRIVVVGGPTTTFQSLPLGFEQQRGLPAGIACAVGAVPVEPSALRGVTAGVDFEHWLGAHGTGPGIDLPRSPFPELGHHGARCYREWPSPRVDAPSAAVQVTGPGGELSCSIRWGRIEPRGPTPAGRYRVETQVGDRTSSARFTLIPGAHFERSSSHTGTVLRAHAPGKPPLLTCVGRPERGEGMLELGADVVGPLEVTVALPTAPQPLILTWRTEATPRRVQVVPSPGGEPTASRDLTLLRGQGGLQLSGPPRAPFTIIARETSFNWCLTAEGERFFPFSALSTLNLRDDQSVRIEVRWPDGAGENLGTFHDPSAKRPSFTHSGTMLAVQLSGTITDNAVIELVKAWEPWTAPVCLPVRVLSVREGTSTRIACEIPETSVPYQFAVMDGDQRISGMALFQGNVSIDPSVGALSASLWRGKVDMAALVERLGAPDGDEILGGFLRCFRRYGAQWFRSADAVAEAISWRTIPLLIEEDAGDDLGDLVAALHLALRRPALAVRYADFARAPGPASAAAWLRAMRALTNTRAGLVLPAWSAWSGAFPEADAQVVPLLLLWQEAEQRLRPLSAAEQEALDTPPSEVGPKVRPRMQGLIEIRQELVELLARSEARTLSHADQRVQHWIREASEAGVPSVLRQREAHREVAVAEAAVVRAASVLHGWRSSSPSTAAAIPWDDLRILWERFPSALDFWLNRLFIHSCPLDP